MDKEKLIKFIEEQFTNDALPILMEYIKIHNLTPSVDPEWNTNNYQMDAAKLLSNWVQNQNIKGLNLTLIKDSDKTPVIYIEIPAFNSASKETFLLYGHFDKQPPYEGWKEGTGPFIPILDKVNNRLYGRGCADDGFAIFASILCIKGIQNQNLSHPRIVVIIEADEESGSVDLTYYLTTLSTKIGNPSLIICMDSVAADYDRLWVSTSLRGIISFFLTVKCLTMGIHSGVFGGTVPDSFMVMRNLISRVEDYKTGRIPDLEVEIPKEVIESTKKTAEILKDGLFARIPKTEGLKPLNKDNVELLLNNAWRPSFAVTGSTGIPDLQNAGNVLRPNTKFKFSFRIPPKLDPAKGFEVIQNKLTTNVPFNSTVVLENTPFVEGWVSPFTQDSLLKLFSLVSQTYYGNDYCDIGFGGSIPVMNVLLKLYPKAQFLITGVCNIDSYAHGPNENLDLTSTKKFICCMAHLISEHAKI